MSLANATFGGVSIDGAAVAPASVRSQGRVSSRAQQLIGLALVTLIPAAFWTAIVAIAAPWLGYQMAMTGLVIAGMTIAAFLGAVCAPIMLKAKS